MKISTIQFSSDRRQFMLNAAAGQACSSCALYQGAAGSADGNCPLFAGKQVSAKAWCNAWAKKG